MCSLPGFAEPFVSVTSTKPCSWPRQRGEEVKRTTMAGFWSNQNLKSQLAEQEAESMPLKGFVPGDSTKRPANWKVCARALSCSFTAYNFSYSVSTCLFLPQHAEAMGYPAPTYQVERVKGTHLVCSSLLIANTMLLEDRCLTRTEFAG
jgi:hypothetical protein